MYYKVLRDEYGLGEMEAEVIVIADKGAPRISITSRLGS